MAVFQLNMNKTRDGKTVVVEEGQVYSGRIMTALTEEEKNLRKLLGLPVTKDLVYYSSSRDENSKIIVDEFEIVEIFQKNDPWFELELHIGDNKVKIHHRYFAEMQSATFISDMNRTQE